MVEWIRFEVRSDMGEPSVVISNCPTCICIPIIAGIIPMHTHAGAIARVKLPWLR